MSECWLEKQNKTKQANKKTQKVPEQDYLIYQIWCKLMLDYSEISLFLREATRIEQNRVEQKEHLES